MFGCYAYYLLCFVYRASKESRVSRPREKKKNMSESGNKMGSGAYCKLETFRKGMYIMGIAFFVLLLSLHIIRDGKMVVCVFVVFCYKTIISTWKISRDHMKGSARKSMGLATG